MSFLDPLTNELYLKNVLDQKDFSKVGPFLVNIQILAKLCLVIDFFLPLWFQNLLSEIHQLILAILIMLYYLVILLRQCYINIKFV